MSKSRLFSKLIGSDGKVTESNTPLTGLSSLGQAIIPDTTEVYDLGNASHKFRDLYLSSSTLHLGNQTISVDASNNLLLPKDILLSDGVNTSQIPEVNLNITAESLAIQVNAVMTGDDMPWVWTWENSSLPFARTPITNSFQLSVPLYEAGNYTISNFANSLNGMLDQTHGAALKWVDGAGFDNEISWASTKTIVSESHPDINGGVALDVQKLTINLPTSVTPPTLTAPSGIGYKVSFATAGSYTFGASNVGGSDLTSVVEGDNPNIGPIYRGSTYTFTLDASLAGHPFYLTTDNGAGFVSGAYVGEYVTGVTGSRNDGSTGKTTLTITVPADAPDNLYYQCGNHGAMRGVITIKDLAVEVNEAGNYVVYFQHTHEGMKTPIELRPLPTLVNQMCLVYDQVNGQFVPQDLATYVENTPSFKNKIKEVAGTATLVAANGTSLVASIKLYEDASYLPYVSNKGGDLAYAKDTKYIYIWNGSTSDWEVTGTTVKGVTGLQSALDGKVDDSQVLTDVPSGALFTDTVYTHPTNHAISEVSGLQGALDGKVDDSQVLTNVPSGALFTDTDTIYTHPANHSISEVTGLQAALDTKTTPGYVDTAITNLIGGAPGTLDTLTELATAINNDAAYASTLTTALATKVTKTTNQALSAAADALTISGSTITLARGDGTTDTVVVPTSPDTWRGISDSTSSTSSVISASSAAVKAAYDRSWPNTTYSVGDGGLSEINFTSADSA